MNHKHSEIQHENFRECHFSFIKKINNQDVKIKDISLKNLIQIIYGFNDISKQYSAIHVNGYNYDIRMIIINLINELYFRNNYNDLNGNMNVVYYVPNPEFIK